MTTAANARLLCVIACVCLLLIAAALRFYNITDQTLRYDEAKVALNSAGGFSEVVDNTRYENSSPILYPIALWVAQKAASTEFSVRFMPAAASVLTVAALLLLMPRAGVARRAAVLAALLAALSAAAVVHAQDAREYSVDALAAALIIAGLLGYLRDGKKALLCAALAAGPLLQYGLALFGVAALAAAALAPSARDAAVGGAQSYAAAIWGRLRGRADLLLPIACFGAACALSWWVTLRYQWTDGGWGSGAYLTDYYYQGGFDAAAIAQFAVGRTWDLLSYHMPTAIAAGALLCFAGLLPWALRRRRMDGLALLAALAVGAAICAALMDAYPLGDIRQCLYLGPIIFLAAGSAFDTVAGWAAARARRAGLAPAMAGAAVVGVAIAGAADLWRHYEAHRSAEGIERIFAALEEREREGDAVYVSRWGVPLVAFYKDEKPDNYYYSKTFCWEPSGGECVSEMFDELFRAFGDSRRIWLINSPQISAAEEMAAYSREAAVEVVEMEEVAANGSAALHLLTRRAELGAGEGFARHEGIRFGPLTVGSFYDVYIEGGSLLYIKQPCVPGDTEARFFLNIYPEDVSVLSESRRQYGRDVMKFDFHDYGLIVDDRCLARLDLPEYAVERIYTGQHIYPDGAITWDVEFQFKSITPSEWPGLYEDVVSGPVSAEAVYDIYIQGNSLYYAKQSCVPGDAEARFFLNIYPEDAGALSEGRRQHGYDIVNFAFHDYGLIVDDRCLMRRDLPDYAVERIHTGQYIYPDGPITWEVEFPFEPFDLSEWLGMYEEVVSAAPRAASTYNVYLRDNALHYAKQPCAPGDTDAHFFLNIYPEDEADLPERRRQYVHDILNFDFRDYGLIAGDRCLIRRELPAYPVKHIHTGQYVYPDGPIVWEVEFPFRP